MGITTQEIADFLGISRGTVDRAINNRPGINEKTKELVLKTAEKLGYTPNLVARSLSKGKTMTLGVVVFDLNNRFFTQLLVAIEAKAREYGYFVYLTSANTDPDEEIACIEHLNSKKVDGLILYSVNRGEKFGQYLKDLGIPIVTICNKVSDTLPYIGLDDRLAIINVMNYLLSKGYTRIVYVTPPMALKGKKNMYSLEQRILGYKETYKKKDNIGKPIIIELPEFDKTVEVMKSMTGQRVAFLCANDLAALEVKDYLGKKGFKVPKDVGIIGFDNIDVLKFISPSLATVNYPIEDMGRIAVEWIVKKTNNEDIESSYILKNEIIEGETI